MAPKKRGDDHRVELVESGRRVGGRVREGGELRRPGRGEPAALIVPAETGGGSGIRVEADVVGVGDESVIKEGDAIPAGEEMAPEAEVGAARLRDGDEVVQGLDGGGGGEEVEYEGAALGDDTECKIEVAEEGQKLPFGASGRDEEVLEEECDPTELLLRERGLESVGVQCDAQELEGGGRANGLLLRQRNTELGENRPEDGEATCRGGRLV